MASQRRVAHAGLALTCAVFASTLTILCQGRSGPVVGQEPTVGVHRTGNSGAAKASHAAARPLKVAAANK